MKISSEDLAALCREHGPNLKLPDGIDGAKLLWAFAGKETSFGKNVVPRHEKAYCYGGRYFTNKELQEQTALHGCLAHQSYGPWQLLFINALRHMKNLDPMRLVIDAGACATVTVAEFNRIIEVQKPNDIREIADAWNSGNWKDDNHPIDYMNDVQGYYQTAILP